MAGADLPAVQRIMRHTDPRITTEFYAHLAPGYLRNAIDRLAINPGRQGELPQPAVAAAFACTLAAGSRAARFQSGQRNEKAASLRRLTWERDIGFEPTTFSLGS